MKKALFLDRDGIINEVVMRDGKPASPRNLNELVLIPEAIELCRTAKNLGFLLILITNQPDVARGLLPRSELKKIHQTISEKIPFDRIEVCTSENDAYFRRKPNPGMLLDSQEALGINLDQSFFLGDSLKDLQAGKKAGVRTILLQTSYNRFIHGLADFNCNSFDEIQKTIKMA